MSRRPLQSPRRRMLAGGLAVALGIVGAVAVAAPAEAATAIGNPVVAPVAQTASTVTTSYANPCNLGNCGAPATVSYGAGSATGRRLVSYTAGGNSYQVLPTADAYSEVYRVDNANVTGDRQSIFLARDAGQNNPLVISQSSPEGRTQADVFSSNVITQGSDNTFANAPASATVNNIERISFLRRTAITASQPARVGLTLVERGGNDPVTVAAVTAVDGDGTPTAWLPVVKIPANAWGPTGVSLPSTVLRKDPGDATYRPNDSTGTQSIAGMYISFADLGVSANQTVYGVSLVGNDETSANPATFRTNTDGGTNGGIDLVGGIFASSLLPTAQNDSSTGAQGAAQSLRIRAAAGDPSTPVDASKTVLLAPAGGTSNGDGSVITVPGVGAYTLNRATNAVSFLPDPAFSGTAPVVTYQVTDANGATATATLAVTVTPVSAPDTSVGPVNTPQVVDVTANDTGSGTTVVKSSLRLLDAAGQSATTVTVPEGVYTIDGDGDVVFTPTTGFHGDATPVRYRVTDAAGNTVGSTYSPTVVPVARPDTSTGAQGVTQTIDVLANDQGTFDPDSLALVGADASGEIVVSGVGTYAVVDGTIAFTPEPGFTGTVQNPPSYTVADTAADIVVTATVTPTVTPVTPTAAPDASSGAQGAAQSVDPLTNDGGGDPAIGLDPTTLTYLDAAGNAVPALTVAGQGAYTIAGGRLVFTPEAGFVGTATPVPYRIRNANGTAAESTYTPTVLAPVVVDASVTAAPGDDAVIDLPAAVPGLDPSTVRLVDGSGDPTARLVVAGQGVWTVGGDGRVTFSPQAGFTSDPTPVAYRAALTDGGLVSGTLTVHYALAALARTGSDGMPALGIAVLLLAAGAAALTFGSRRRRA